MFDGYINLFHSAAYDNIQLPYINLHMYGTISSLVVVTVNVLFLLIACTCYCYGVTSHTAAVWLAYVDTGHTATYLINTH